MTREGAWMLSAFAQSANITGARPPATRYACSALRPTSSCVSLSPSLCIECAGQAVADVCAP
jgi:hypothetical protein